MPILPDEKDKLISRNRAELGDAYDLLKFATDEEACKARDLRNEILTGLGSEIDFRRKGTKPVYRGISPGCELCGNGSWSCLFISGKCNCRCFYCPAEQTEIGLPTTNTLTFPNAQDYVDYVEQLGFTGVSISGGEPLLTLDATLNFITAVKKKLGNRIYLWLYTNGTLVDRDILGQLKDAGLNEIRFDIGAVGYSLEKARMAVSLIEHVTVEIPAVPEDYETMTNKIREMSDSGLSFLNLHQLRLTPHNLPNLLKRPYTYLHGEHVTVLESELTALKLIRHASENRIPLPINYCSFVYKNRFQRAAARNRCGRLIKKTYEDMTENGHIRSLHVKGTADVMGALAESLRQNGCPADLWFMPKEKDRLFFSATLWNRISFVDCALFVSYFDSRLVPSVTYRNPFKEVRLNPNRSIFVERARAAEDMEILPEERVAFEAVVLRKNGATVSPDATEKINRVTACETITPGLQNYE